MANTTKKSALYIHALTPIHAGTGQVSASVVDLPIARDKTTNWPILPATSLKGVLKAAVALDNQEKERLFGSSEKPGSLQFGDARLLCFPVRSQRGVFAYATSCMALSRLLRDFTALSVPIPFTGSIPSVIEDASLVTQESVLHKQCKIWLDDLELDATEDTRIAEIAAGIANDVFDDEADRKIFKERFILVSDAVFDFLAETATEITARIKLKYDCKMVDKEAGALWYEEAVPAEAIFAAPLLGDALPMPGVVQIGGNESVGRGICRIKEVRR